MALAGDVVLVKYDVEGPVVWHERIILAVHPRSAGVYVILTPDGDIYEESYNAENEDVAAVLATRGSGDTPAGVGRDAVYRFDVVPSGAAFNQLLRDAAVRVGAPAPTGSVLVQHAPVVQPGQQVAAPPPIAGAIQGPAGPRPAVLGPAEPPRPAGVPAAPVLPAGHVWVVAEDVDGLAKGTELTELPPGALVMGERAIFQHRGSGVFAKSMASADIYRFTHDDLRVCPIQYDPSGEREISFRDAVSRMDPTPPLGGRGVEGPDTSMWFLRHVRDHSSSPEQHHEHWLRQSRIPEGDRAQYEHEVLCKILWAMSCVDQLNVPALLSGEYVVRRLQLIKEAYRLSPSAPDFSAADFFMGWGARRHGAVIDPNLARHVAAQLKADAEIQKEARKAREERAHQPRGGGRGGKGARGGRGLAPAGDAPAAGQ